MAADLAVGDRAPAFTLPASGGGKISLKDYKGAPLVLYFYPKADTSGCTREAIDFTRLKSQFGKAGAAVLGVSADPVPALDRFAKKHKLGIALASDEPKDMLAAYGAWGEKSMYGRKFMGVIRKTFLIDDKGRIAAIWPKVKVDGHAEAVLAAVKAL
jgi:peroxiredoxin Q/BCP